MPARGGAYIIMDKRTEDPYRVLGLPPNADSGRVRKAFRELAKIFHPDRTGGSGEHFLKISRAYEEISRGADFIESEDQPGAGGGRDIFAEIHIELEEAALGCRTTFSYERKEPCLDCRPRPRPDCPVCLGLGTVYRTSGKLLSPCPCPRCGRNKKAGPCSSCKGADLVNSKASVYLELPPGIMDSDELLLSGQGDYPPCHGHLPGDLYLKIRIKPHSLFKISNSDIHLTWNPAAWPSGKARLAPTLYGQVRLKTNPAPGRTIKLASYGLPSLDSPDKGDMYIHY